MSDRLETLWRRVDMCAMLGGSREAAAAAIAFDKAGDELNLRIETIGQSCNSPTASNSKPKPPRD
jgi:hypothetical protein